MGLRKPGFFLVGLLGVIGVSYGTDQPLLFVSDRDYPPVTYLENGLPKGLWVDLASAVGKRLGQPFSITLDDWSKAQIDVQQGRADVLFDISNTPERRALYDLSLPLATNQFTFFTRGLAGIETLNDLPGRRVGVTPGGLPRRFVASVIGATVMPIETYQQAFSALEDGSISVFAADRWVGSYILSQGRWPNITAASGNFASLPSGFAVKKGNLALLNRLNDAIRQFKATNGPGAIESEWAPKSVVFLTQRQLTTVGVVVVVLILLALLGWVLMLLGEIRRRQKAESMSDLLKLAFESAAWGLIISNPGGQNPVFLNYEAARMHGYEPSEMAGFGPTSTISAENKESPEQIVRKAVELGSYTTEVLRVRRDGSVFPSITTLTSLPPLRGRKQGFAVSILDISAQKKIEEELQQAQRLESLGLLAGGIAHDFNNIMAGLRGVLDLVKLHLGTGNLELALQKLDKGPPLFSRGKALTTKLLTFAKGGAPVRVLVALGPLLKEWAELALIGSDLTLSCEIQPQLWNCHCDVNQIGQVVNNLVINAREASPAGTVVTIRALNTPKPSPFVAIEITDQGPGIPRTNLEKIFDPFFTTKTKGTGLGLAVSFSIAKQHSGWIEVQTSAGAGSTFTLFLPATKGDLVPRPVLEACSDFVGQGVAIVMDDEASVRDSVAEMLGLFGFEVHCASHGSEVLRLQELFALKATPVNLFLLDLTVPGEMGGLAVARRLRDRGEEGAIVIMSGYSEQMATDQASTSTFPWLSKPFSQSELCDTLGRLEQPPA